MKIGDRVYVHGYVDEIRKDTVIIRNEGGYFGTVKSEIVEAQKAEDIVSVVRCKDCKWGREISGNIECNADRNNPPEYHGYGWFCPLGEERKMMTFDDLLDKFHDAFPFAKVEDYRPICHELFTDDKVGITIWMKNGDVIEYYPATEEDSDD